MLGENVENHDRLLIKVRDITTKIEKKRTHVQTMKAKIDKLKEINNKLTDGYELSLRMVVDVSKLLQNYTKMFDDLEKLLSALDQDMGVQQTDIQYISHLTKESIRKISDDFNNQFPSIVEVLEKNGNRETMSYATRLKGIVNQLPSDATAMKQLGGKKGTKKKTC